ncbi:hypothetical protein BO78DRAFT_407665 [Aspergillus sclerotiicarbonarius CBS 121057]|uniref:Transcription factor domain-containing protein n=1 Tax=Aspergillus sclerotiicarbonarius (strain CBS 121057 / IBT 28362) TaxID=1448318 RepID=A0A319E9E7_ASPSB|nr:hypothetical protein BO78DRAFT_407665 [Aspergillus sclerotiicarbonarius CBS 121057]
MSNVTIMASNNEGNCTLPRFDAEASLSAIAERLEEMESVLREHSNALNQLKAVNTMSVSTPDTISSQPQNLHSPSVYLASPHGSGVSRTTSRAIETAPEATLPPMTIPLWHSTTTGSLLSCPLVRSLLGDYPSDVFLRIEERRPLPDQLKACKSGVAPNMPLLDRAITDNLMELYFQSVNLQHPILSYEDCIAHYHSVASEPLQASLDSSFVLVMLALADVATTHPPEKLDADWSPGSIYFSPAMTITLDAYFNATIATPVLSQCLYLTALYYNYLARPLDAWKLVHMASTSFQRLWISDLITEHHLPRSGIENLVDRLHLPLCGDPPDPSLLAWLAELSARRLLNRVHHALYADDQEYLLQADYVTRSSCGGQEEEAIIKLMRSSLNVSMELDAQLNNWYDLIPQIIKPDLTQTTLSIRDAMIALRHYSAKDIIFRPFLLFACSLPSTIRPPQSLLEIFQTTVYSCRQYVRVAAIRLSEPSASTEIDIHS